MKRKEGNIFRNYFAEYILILPGNLKIGERCQIYKIFLAEHIKFCQEAWKKKKRSNISEIFLQ